ncbi:efflux RND transporter permease subunit [Salicibibacter halophilus]|uniref:Efflux RND transporter permease subunit n=1 Tax=Salicibibacter halophilus TaxID=2502791 RepID=A0A514LHW5_9BACI|nr:efflux RND transporter permease subunit [Salicibibacter halophilus]QDI91432.1 efflux RND transporter permease subunit [Salicibibacter halophilus]
MKISNFSIGKPKFTIVIMLLFIIVGIVSLTRLPLNLFPDVEAPVAAVATSYEGAGPEEVLSDVTEELEGELAATSGLDDMTSQSSEGSSIIILEFTQDTSIDEVETDIVSTITQAELPDDAGQPSFIEFDPSMLPTMQLAVSGNGDEVGDFQDDALDLHQELSRIDGVADIEEDGSLTELYDVQLNQDDLNDANMTQSDVVDVIQGHDIAVPGGVIEDDDRNITTRVMSELTDQEDLEELVVSQDPATGDEITLDDVASISFTTEDEDAITRANQEAAMQFSVMEESDANTTQVEQMFNDELSTLLQEDAYEDLTVTTLYSEGEFIQDAVDNVAAMLVAGGALAMVVLFAFLRNLKTPLIIGLSMPFSIIVTFALFYFADMSLNMLTLGGLALGIGMLLDNSIVVIENIYRHLSMRKPPKEAAYEGTKEVGAAITASTLTTIAVFLPVVFITGLVGDLFAPLALAVSFSILASLIVALTVVPMIASRVLRTPSENVEEERQRNSRLINVVEKGAKWALRRRFVVVTITLVLLAIGAYGLTTAGLEFMPEADEGSFMVEVEHDFGTQLEQTDETVADIEEEIDDHPEIDNYMSTVGSSAMDEGLSEESHIAEIMINLVPVNDRDMTTTEFSEMVESDLENIDTDAEVDVNVMSQAAMGDPNTYAFSINDPSSERLEETADDLVEELEDESAINQVDTSLEETAPELQVLINEDDARDEGLVPAQIAESVNEVTTGVTATSIQSNENDLYEVNVRGEEELTESVDDFESITIQNEDGDNIPLSDVADIEEGEEPATIERADMIPSVEFDVVYGSGYNLGEISTLVDDVVADYELEDDAEYVVGGDQEMLDDAMESMVLAFVLGIIFVYLVMVAQFESFKYPFVIMFTVPFFVIGVMLALTITQTPISIVALIGMLVLTGIVLNNAIVLVDYANQRKAQGMRAYDALITAVKDRARPILIMAISTILAVAPLSLGIGEGAEIQQPMAIVVIGGLISSTFLTLFVIPVIYSFVDPEIRNMNKKYVTPEGDIVYARDLPPKQESGSGEDVREREVEQTDEPATSDSTEEHSSDEREKDLSGDDIMDALEELLRRRRDK